ncbi:unnamed protein product [Brassica oleracea var. botrytis]
MGFCVMRYCWWSTVFQIGGDGCHNSASVVEVGLCLSSSRLLYPSVS